MRTAADALAQAALQHVQVPARGVRVEDYLTTLAAMTGEAAILAAGFLDLEASDVPPGSPLFGDPTNHVLSGDTTDLAAAPADSVIGILVAELVPGTVPLALFGSIEDVYRHVAASVGKAPWGAVTVSVPEANWPTVLPIQVAFELRPAVDGAVAKAGLPANLRHVPCAVGLADAIKQVQGAIDPAVAVRLAIEVTFGMAKLMPMSRKAFEAVAR